LLWVIFKELIHASNLWRCEKPITENPIQTQRLTLKTRKEKPQREGEKFYYNDVNYNGVSGVLGLLGSINHPLLTLAGIYYLYKYCLLDKAAEPSSV